MVIKAGYIRVSEILAQWDRFGHINSEVLQHKADIGTNVHLAIDAHGDDIAFPLHEGSGYLESFVKWQRTTQAQSIHASQRLYCDKLKITGEVDSIVKFHGTNKLVLVDFKTSAAKDDKFWQLQGQFYHYLCGVNSIQVEDRFLFVKLDKDGEMPKVFEYKASSSLLNVCMSAYICYKYVKDVA